MNDFLFIALIRHYWFCSITNSGVLGRVRPIAVVQRDKRMQDEKNMTASQPVNFFNTSAVDVPNSESLDSPPKDAPRPVLLLS